MARHSDGRPNYRVAKGPLAVLLLAVLLVAAVAAWAIYARGTAEDRAAGGGCTRGDLSIRVVADPAVADRARELVQAYGDTAPVVRDHCVRPVLDESGAAGVVDAIRAAGEGDPEAAAAVPAVWIPASDAAVAAAEGLDVVAFASPRARLSPEPVGLAVPAGQRDALRGRSWEELRFLEVAAPGGADAEVSALVDAHLSAAPDEAALRAEAVERARATGEDTAGTLLGRLAAGEAPFAAVAATQSMIAPVGEALGFVSPEGSSVIAAPVVPLGAGGPVDEAVARAAADFTAFAAEHGRTVADEPSPAGPAADRAAAVAPALAELRTSPFAAEPEPAAPAGPPAGSALVLLDASAGAGLDRVRPALDPLLAEAGAPPERRVALWNFSSPQSPGVVTPVRANVYLADALPEYSRAVLGEIGEVGEPWLWRSVQPAYAHAQEAYQGGRANRLVLLTYGADAAGDDGAAAVAAIRAAHAAGPDVRVDVVLLGEDRTGGLLAELAEATGGAVHDGTGDLPAALRAALGL